MSVMKIKPNLLSWAILSDLVTYRIVGNFRGMKLSWNCVKSDFHIFLIHESLENKLGKVIAMCLNHDYIFTKL